MKTNIVRTSAALACVATLLLAGAAQATLVTVDQVIYENGGSGVNPGLLSGTVDVTVSGSQQLTILVQNTSPDASFANGSQPGSMILSGLGLQLGGVNIVSGTVTVNSGSTAVNFDIGQSLTDISNQWGYGNTAAGAFGSVSGVLAVNNTVSSLHAEGPNRFAGPPPTSIDGPAYGAISKALVLGGKFTTQAAVMDTIKLVLNLDGAAPSAAAIDAGDVVLGFGSPGSVAGTTVPDGGMTLVLLGMGLAGIACFARRHKLA
jgi:hypothetical protein